MKLFIRVCWWLPDPDASELFSSSSNKSTSPLISDIFYRPPSTVVKEDRGKATVMWVFLLAAFVAYVVYISVNAVEMRKNPPVQILRKVRACLLTERQTGYEGREHVSTVETVGLCSTMSWHGELGPTGFKGLFEDCFAFVRPREAQVHYLVIIVSGRIYNMRTNDFHSVVRLRLPPWHETVPERTFRAARCGDLPLGWRRLQRQRRLRLLADELVFVVCGGEHLGRRGGTFFVNGSCARIYLYNHLWQLTSNFFNSLS